MVTSECRIRRARPGDWLAVETLIQEARRVTPRLWAWEDYLREDLFIIVERRGRVAGAFFAWPDDSPIAWVRLAALVDDLDIEDWLSLVLPATSRSLRHRGTQGLVWMDAGHWATPHLERHGFQRLTEVVTLAKLDCLLPSQHSAEALVRPVLESDWAHVVTVDRAAFTPHWWYGQATLRQRISASPCFAVAQVAGEIVGYAEGELRLPVAHLSRIAVRPEYEGHGIGATLLRHVLLEFWRCGADQVTLNTQADNERSRRLYHRFGFGSSEEPATVWELLL